MPLTIETLKQFALDVHNYLYGTEWDDLDIVSAMDFDGIIDKMKDMDTAEKVLELDQKVRALESERKGYWDDFNPARIASLELGLQRLQLEKENKKLKAENAELKKHIQTVAKVQGGQMERDADNLCEAARCLKILKKENAELKEKLDKVGDYSIGASIKVQSDLYMDVSVGGENED
jgi:hypothetical protein